MNTYIIKNKPLFCAYIILVPLMAITSIAATWSVQPLIDLVYSKENIFLLYGMLAIVLTCVDMGIACIHKLVREKLRCSFMVNIKREIFGAIMNKNINEYYEEDSAYYLNILSRDIQCMNNQYFESFCGIYRVVTSTLITGMALVAINPLIVVVSLILSVMASLIPKLFSRKLELKQQEVSVATERYISKLKNYLTGFTTIRLFGIKEQVKGFMDEVNISSERTNYECSRDVYLSSWISMLCTSLSYIVSIIIGVVMVKRGQMSFGKLVVLLQMIGGMLIPFEELPGYVAGWSSSKVIREKLLGIINAPNKQRRLEEETKLQYINKQYKMGIVFERVTFGYNKTQEVLKSISFKLERGKKYVLIGESGSGKSTIAKLILGVLTCDEGNVLIESEAISRYSQEEVYRYIHYMQQDTFIFEDSIYQNIALYQNRSIQEVLEIVKQVGLDKCIENMEGGIYSELSENGMNISGGEKQRIAIARALLSGSQFLVLDEMTSNLDAVVEKEIEQLILELREVGCLIITHKLTPNLVAHCDEILVLKQGAIVEQGNYKELMDMKGDFYKYYMISHYDNEKMLNY